MLNINIAYILMFIVKSDKLRFETFIYAQSMLDIRTICIKILSKFSSIVIVAIVYI